MSTTGIGHVNIVVEDLERMAGFFVKHFGFAAGPTKDLDAEWVEKLTGFKGAAARYLPLSPPEGAAGTRFEILKYIVPPPPLRGAPPTLNVSGYRHIGFEVEDIDSKAADLAAQGYHFFSEVVTVPEMGVKTVYFYGPEQIILQLTQKLPAPTPTTDECTVASDGH